MKVCSNNKNTSTRKAPFFSNSEKPYSSPTIKKILFSTLVDLVFHSPPGGLLRFFFLFLPCEFLISLSTMPSMVQMLNETKLLFADCAPHSVNYILELLGMRHCAGCQFYRAEGRGSSWDSEGNHIENALFGPPFALIQGTLEAQGVTFKNIPTEACPTIRRGSVAWVGSGPEFFISLANHKEWSKDYTVFGALLPEDMEIAERIATLPSKPDVWGKINVSVLEKPIHLSIQRIKKSNVDMNTDADTDSTGA